MRAAPGTISMGEGRGRVESTDGVMRGAGRFHLELAGSDVLVCAGDADEGIDRLLRGLRHGGSPAAPS